MDKVSPPAGWVLETTTFGGEMVAVTPNGKSSPNALDVSVATLADADVNPARARILRYANGATTKSNITLEANVLVKKHSNQAAGIFLLA